jgi:hypothetical protein
VSIKARLRRLETRVEVAKKNCPCGGPGRAVYRFGGEPDPGPCPRCGTTGVLVRIVRDEPPEGWDERWAHLRDPA